MNNSSIVSILMPAYNHKKYISQAIKSVLAQKTNYPYELLIHDDCSTDSTLTIAQDYATKYPDKIKLFTEKENQGLMKSYKRLIEQSNGKYFAILESDDYWLDENKLQIQIDFLENNPDYGIVAGDIITIDDEGNEIKKGGFNSDKASTDFWYTKLLGLSGFEGACAIIFRRDLFNTYCNINDYIDLGFKTFDQPTWLSISYHSKCKVIPKILAAYRHTSTSLSNNIFFEKHIDFILNIIEIEKYIIEKYGLNGITQNEYNNRISFIIMGKALKFHKLKLFCEYAKKLKPISIKQKFMRYFPHLYYWQFIIRH